MATTSIVYWYGRWHSLSKLCSFRTVFQISICLSSSLLLQSSSPGSSTALPSLTGLLLYISSWTSRMILPVSHVPSSFLCLWLCSAFLPFQDRSSNSTILASFISLSSSFNTTFHFCSWTQCFSSLDPRAAAAASAGNWLEMQILVSCHRQTESQTLGVGLSHLDLTSFPSDSDAC